VWEIAGGEMAGGLGLGCDSGFGRNGRAGWTRMQRKEGNEPRVWEAGTWGGVRVLRLEVSVS
jgi:hypothetical protein